jgi:hypothetical protein
MEAPPRGGFLCSFSIIYLHDAGVVSIVAVAHSKRKPGYWKQPL